MSTTNSGRLGEEKTYTLCLVRYTRCISFKFKSFFNVYFR